MTAPGLPPTPLLERALHAAVAAARAAGRHLAAEAAREGGPRGPSGDCPADGEAEAIIRQALQAATPEFGLVAEESPEHDRAPAEPGGPVWVIDPNDGTASFQQGRRGAAVSIGLVQGGQPILGVVLAHSAPTGGDDLFTWGEGLGPLRRNGRPVASLAPRGPLRPLDVVLVSAGAELHPLSNALALSPARFLPMPSIAYRLALVAAGEAAGTVSLQLLDAHDVAGGHALLRAAGLVLVGPGGEPVRYAEGGRTRVGPVAAGSPEVASDLARRIARGLEPSPRERGALDLCPPRPGRPARDVALLQRAQGALLGQVCGDSLGSLVEFQRPDEIAEDWPAGVRDLVDGGTWNTVAGQPTDDSELALALARSLVRAGRYDPLDVLDAYVTWYDTRPFDIGHTTRAALSAAADTRRAGGGLADATAAAHGSARLESKANGALMRVSPLGVFGQGRDLAQLRGWAREDARLTHPHPVCQDASAVFAAAVAMAVAGGPTPVEVADAALAMARAERLEPEVVEALERARHDRPDFLTHHGLVTVALQNAFYQLRHASPEEGIVDTVRQGGDTDTNAAIAGALLGAVHGVHAWPLRWRNPILTCFPVAGSPGVKRPRPPGCWAVDVLVVAERLVAG